MRSWVLALLVGVVGALVLTAVVAAVDNGRDNTGETVRAERWADDVCSAVGAWEGQLEVIGDEVELNNVGTRRSDGGSGDQVEGTVYVRTAVDRVIEATDVTLQEGLKRAGTPDVPRGRQASLVLRNWAQATENELVEVKRALDEGPNTTAAAFAALGQAVGALEDSALAGRAAFRQVARLDPELADAIESSGNCRRLMDDQP